MSLIQLSSYLYTLLLWKEFVYYSTVQNHLIPQVCPQLAKNSTSFRIILNEVTKLAELLEHSKYFFRLPTTCKKFYKLIKES